MNLIFRLVWNPFLAACIALGLVACGGGGGGSSDAASPILSLANTLNAKPVFADPTLVGQEISLVNTTTVEDQQLRSIGSLTDGGYTVAWMSGTALYIQRYDSAGNKSGTETAIPVVLDSRDTASQIIASSSIAVLSDGTVVVAYSTFRSSADPYTPNATERGVYVQRFDASGVQILPETELAILIGGDPRRPTAFGNVQVLPMPDGGYVVGWGTFATSATVGSRNSFSTQRFDSQNQRVGGVVNIGTPGTISAQNRIVADANGGYTAYWSGLGADFLPTGLTVTHYDANQSATQILTAWPGTALLVPLEDGRGVLYTSDAGSVYRQVLDSAGAPVGESTAVSSMPVSAQLLVDGSYVVFWQTNGTITAQRFDSTGAAIGNVLTIESGGIVPAITDLADGGFALAWSAPGPAGDLDVFTQRFIEVNPDQAALRAKRMACLASAKGITGQERKAFMNACMQYRQPGATS
jgi:hypothetical protein